MEAMFLRGDDVGVSSLLSELLEAAENTAEDFFLRIPFGLLPSSSIGTCMVCRIGATPPSLSESESSLNEAGSRVTLCARVRRPEEPTVSGDVSKESAR